MIKPNIWVDVENRHEIMRWLNEHGLTGAAAEVGVWSGQFMELFLNEWKGIRYYAVDLWARQDPEVYRENTNDDDFDGAYRKCQEIAERDRRVTLIKSDSVKAAALIEDGSLDFVHLDANHAYGAVLDDMNAWWPKLKSGGVFSGDDYLVDVTYPSFCEVKKATDRWFSERRLTFTVCRRPAWWCVKP